MKVRVNIVLMMLLLAATAAAAPRHGARGVTHWLGVSVAGFEANPVFGKGTDVQIKAGGGGQATLLYEIHKNAFFFNIGVGADYTVTNSALQTYSEAFDRLDRMNDPVLYRYCYSDIAERQNQLRVIVPVQFGYEFGDWVYVGVGAAFRSAPLMNSFATSARMFTEGEYNRYIEPIRNTDYYGYWAEQEYKGKGTVQSATHEMAVEAEVGVRVPLKSGILMRAGVFIGYDIPLIPYGSKREAVGLGDYAAVDTNPFTQSQANLSSQMRFLSMNDASMVSADPQRLRAGVKLTFLFNVAYQPRVCMCLKY